MSMKKYTEPYITPGNLKPRDVGKEWRVRFSYFHNGVWQRVSFTNDMNRIKDYKERLQTAKALQKFLSDKLRLEGWNPINDTYAPEIHPETDERLKKIKLMPLNEAMQFAFDKRKSEWSYKTIQDYGGMLEYLKKAAYACQIQAQAVNHFQVAHFKLLLESVEQKRKLSHSGYNKYRDFLSTLVSELIQWDIIQYNYVHSIRAKKEPKTFAHRPPTSTERNLIVDKIKSLDPNYYIFLSVLYGCTLRPKEILLLTVSDLSFENQTLRLKAQNAKTGTERFVAVPTWLIDMLREFKLTKYKSTDYIFSTTTKGKFLPGPNKMHPNIPTSYWKKIVKDGLKLNITQYSLKKLAGNDMIKIQRMEGVDKLLELPRQQMGHANTKQTEVYVTDHVEYINDVIRQKMPVL